MTHFTVVAYVNEAQYHFEGYLPAHTVMPVMTFEVKADTPRGAADAVWAIGNRMAGDIHGMWWPSEVRSLSVGDVLRVYEHDYVRCTTRRERISWLAIASFGFDDIAEPAVAPMVGATW